MKVVIITPVFNDWESFTVLLHRIDQIALSNPIFDNVEVSIMAIDDGSTLSYKKHSSEWGGLQKINLLEILSLNRNVGHQKAITIALASISREPLYDAVVIMDSDGEDQPEDISKLLARHLESGERIVFAQRKKRSEGVVFVLLYKIYKLVYRVLTGFSISFGNFCLIPQKLLKRLVNVSEIWNHFSGGVIRSKLPITTIETNRGTRFCGISKMNLTTLIIHGLSAISVQIDIVAVRFLLISIILILFSIISILVVVGVKFLTAYATPGWASTVVFGFTMIVMQAFFVSLFLVFIILTYRTQKLFIPYYDYEKYVDFKVTIAAKESRD
ncbi:glycosyltransferase [bacterium]|nr:glycosyltransferase [bacterium]